MKTKKSNKIRVRKTKGFVGRPKSGAIPPKKGKGSVYKRKPKHP